MSTIDLAELQHQALSRIDELSKEGKSDEQIAEMLFVSTRTIRRWRARDVAPQRGRCQAILAAR